MSNFFHDTAAFALPVTASFAALAAAFVAFAARRQAVAVVAADRIPTVDLMGTTGWFGGNVKRITSTSYVPQSRGSTG